MTCGKPGHLLFYDPQNNRQLMNLDVMNRNFVSSPEELELSTIEITHVAFFENTSGLNKTNLITFVLNYFT